VSEDRDDALADVGRLVERQAATIARLQAQLRDAQEDEARAMNDAWNYLHEVRSAANAVRLAKQHAAAYRTQRDAVLARLGQAQACTHGVQEVAA
jgi:hypothetical protein